MSDFFGVDSEVGRLRTVLVHRPGAELRRSTPRRGPGMRFGAPPWVERAQAEHDAFTSVLRNHGVTVLYLTELLQDVLEYAPARQRAIESVLSQPRLGGELRGQLEPYLEDLCPEELARLLIMGLARDEFRGGRGAVFSLLSAWDFVIDPLPNLVFARDISMWIGDSVAVASPSGRRMEAELAATVFGHHPMFAGASCLHEPGHELLTGGDVLILAPGVVAVGIGAQTSPAGLEKLAGRALASGFAHTVLAVLTGDQAAGRPSDGQHGTGAECLDTLCTVTGTDTVMMCPAVAFSLTARTVTRRGEGLRLSHPKPFLEAAAQAMGIRRLNLIETGFAPGRPGTPAGLSGQWDDAANLLVLGPGTVISYERNVVTNARLEAAGIMVIRVPGGELAGRRGGPRAICSPVSRDPMAKREAAAAAAGRNLPDPRQPAESLPRTVEVPGQAKERERVA